jgi:hypothetical protein
VARAALADAIARAECKGGVGKFCRERDAAVGWCNVNLSCLNGVE